MKKSIFIFTFLSILLVFVGTTQMSFANDDVKTEQTSKSITDGDLDCCDDCKGCDIDDCEACGACDIEDCKKAFTSKAKCNKKSTCKASTSCKKVTTPKEIQKSE